MTFREKEERSATKYQPKPKIICISGKAQHGKDTTAGFLKECFTDKARSVLIAHYGDLVKYICKTFFDWDGQKDERGRTLLQEVGTDTVRTRTPDFWVRFIKDVLDHFPDKWDYVIIPDCRFPNEVDYLKEYGYDVIHVRVFRGNFISPLTIEQQKHASEMALDHVVPDYLIYNGFGLEDLRTAAYNVGYAIADQPKRDYDPVARAYDIAKKVYHDGDQSNVAYALEEIVGYLGEALE